MKDIRINKSKISTSIVRLDPTFLKMNFVFFGKIFKKYTKNSEMELYLLEKIPLVFLINKEDNEPLFKAISEILDELRIKKEDKDETNVQNTVVKNRFFEDSENKIFKYSVNNAGNFENFKNFQFVHKKSFNNQHVTEAIKSLVLNIKKNINLKTNDDDRNKDYDENVGQKLIKKSNKLEENVSKIKSKKINYEQKLKVREDKNITKKSQKTIVEDEIVSKKTEDVDINLRDIQLKKITLQLKKINEKIIDRKIKNIRINKIDFDFLNKRNFLSQKINSKLNKVVSSIVFKDQKIKNISKVSSSIVLFHRKFKNLSDIKDIENTVMHHKTKNKKINRIYENINKNQKILKRFLPSVTSFNKKLVINKTNKNKIISYIEESKLKYSNNIFKKTSNYLDRNIYTEIPKIEIVHRKKINLEELIEKNIKKNFEIHKENRIFEIGSQRYKNERLQNLIKTKNQAEKNDKKTKEDIENMIKSHINLINFEYISDKIVSKVGQTIALEKYRNGIF